MKIDSNLVALAEKHYACPDAVAWLRESPRTVAELVAQNRLWARWAAKNIPLPTAFAVALETAGCGRSWWREGQRHRDGDEPAVVWANGSREWWREGKRYTPPKNK